MLEFLCEGKRPSSAPLSPLHAYVMILCTFKAPKWLASHIEEAAKKPYPAEIRDLVSDSAEILGIDSPEELAKAIRRAVAKVKTLRGENKSECGELMNILNGIGWIALRGINRNLQRLYDCILQMLETLDDDPAEILKNAEILLKNIGNSETNGQPYNQSINGRGANKK